MHETLSLCGLQSEEETELEKERLGKNCLLTDGSERGDNTLSIEAAL